MAVISFVVRGLKDGKGQDTDVVLMQSFSDYYPRVGEYILISPEDIMDYMSHGVYLPVDISPEGDGPIMGHLPLKALLSKTVKEYLAKNGADADIQKLSFAVQEIVHTPTRRGHSGAWNTTLFLGNIFLSLPWTSMGEQDGE